MRMMSLIIGMLLLFGCVADSSDSLSAKEKAAMDAAIDDEYKARATYKQVIDDFGSVKPFTNILAAEETHIDSLEALYDKYGLQVPQDRWAGNASSYSTLQDACAAGVAAEIANAAMYDDLLEDVDNKDIIQVFQNLQSASRNNHLPAFQKCD
jgi:hypothetical protein